MASSYDKKKYPHGIKFSPLDILLEELFNDGKLHRLDDVFTLIRKQREDPEFTSQQCYRALHIYRGRLSYQQPNIELICQKKGYVSYYRKIRPLKEDDE